MDFDDPPTFANASHKREVRVGRTRRFFRPGRRYVSDRGGRRAVSSEIQKLLAKLVTEEGIRLPAPKDFKVVKRLQRDCTKEKNRDKHVVI